MPSRLRLALTPGHVLELLLPIAIYVLAVMPVSDPDLWWHLRSGQWIVESRDVPRSDFFSFTAAGAKWIEHEWLANAAMYLLHLTGGVPTLILAAAFVIMLTFIGVYLLSEGRPHLAVFTTLAAALAGAFTWDARPHILSMLFAVAALLIIRRARRGDARSLLALPPLFALWVNVHSGFILGLVLIGTAWVGDAGEYVLARYGGRRLPALASPGGAPAAGYLAWLALAGVAAALACLANPYGTELVRAPLATLGNRTIPLFISEWRSPDLHDPRFLPFLALWVGLISALAFSGRRPSLTDLLYILGFGYAAWLSARNIPFFAITSAPVITRLVVDGSPQRAVSPARPVSRALALANAALLAFSVLAGTAQVASVLASVPSTTNRLFPVGATDFVLRARPPGPLLNSYNFGGYLIWRLFPDYKVFIDGRAEFVYSDAFVSEYYDRVWRAAGDYEAYLGRWGIRLIVIETRGALAAQLLNSPKWQRIYFDDTASVFGRDGAP